MNFKERVFVIKRVSIIVGVLVLLWGGYFYLEHRAEFDYKQAQSAFVSGGDEKAFKLAKSAYLSDITNNNYRKLFLDTIIRLDGTYDAQEALISFIDDGIYDIYQTKAIEYLHTLEKRFAEKYQPNYIDLIPYNDKIIRWGKSPIKVGIKKRDDLDLYFINEVESALMEWQRATDNKLVFVFEDSKNPDITIEFEELNLDKENKNNHNLYVVANTEPVFDGNTLQNMKITMYTKNNQGKYFTKEEVYNTALHEAAHALGIFGHSRHPEDVLYLSSPNVAGKKEYKKLSESDINTMKLLYEIRPDITSGKPEYSIHPKVIYGEPEEINKTKVTEAENYIKQAPSLPNGYIDLAQTAIFAKDYDKARDCLKRAIKYAVDNNTKFIIYYDFAVICYETGDMNKALYYTQKAQEFRSKNSVTALLANIYYKKRDYKKAIEQYEILVSKYPQSIMYSVNLTKLYINQRRLIKAAKVLKHLIATNQEAADDKRVKGLKWVLIFAGK